MSAGSMELGGNLSAMHVATSVPTCCQVCQGLACHCFMSDVARAPSAPVDVLQAAAGGAGAAAAGRRGAGGTAAQRHPRLACQPHRLTRVSPGWLGFCLPEQPCSTVCLYDELPVRHRRPRLPERPCTTPSLLACCAPVSTLRQDCRCDCTEHSPAFLAVVN